MRTLLLLLTSVLVLPAARAQAPTLEPLGDLPGGDFFSTAAAVSADGTTVVGYSTSANGTEAFRWTASGSMEALGDLPGGAFNSGARDVSADGSVVVGVGASESGQEAFRWEGGVLQGLGFLADYPFSDAHGVSSDGGTVVGVSTDGVASRRAFRWTAGGGMEALADLPGGNDVSEAFDVTADGSIIVGRCLSAEGREACRWVDGGPPEGLGDLDGGGGYATAYGVSPDGAVVVGECTSASGREACRWRNGVPEGLGVIPGASLYESAATGTTADGSLVVGWSYDVQFVVVPVLWLDGGVARYVEDVLVNEFGVDLVGWTDVAVSAVTPDGRVLVGSGRNPSGVFEAFRLVLGEGTPVEAVTPDTAPLSLTVAPNPVRGTAALHLVLAAPEVVTVTVYDGLGRRVAALHDGPLAAGGHAFRFEAGDLPSGVYAVRASGASGAVSRRVTLVR